MGRERRERERERERQTETETETETERQRETERGQRQRQTETDRARDRDRDRESERERETETDRVLVEGGMEKDGGRGRCTIRGHPPTVVGFELLSKRWTLCQFRMCLLDCTLRLALSDGQSNTCAVKLPFFRVPKCSIGRTTSRSNTCPILSRAGARGGEGCVSNCLRCPSQLFEMRCDGHQRTHQAMTLSTSEAPPRVFMEDQGLRVLPERLHGALRAPADEQGDRDSGVLQLQQRANAVRLWGPRGRT